MKIISLLRVFLVMQVACACSPEASPPTETPTEPERHYDRVVLHQVLPALRSTNNVGRIYYEANCHPGDLEFPIPFPRVDVLPPLQGATGVDVVRSIFRKEKENVLVEKVGPIIQMRFGKAPEAILRTRIRQLNLDPVAQYNPSEVINRMLNSPDVQAAMAELHLETPQRIYSMILTQPAEGLPHLPAQILNITMDQALDMIATTWSGVVLYGACTQRGIYEMSFADSNGVVGSTWE
jgi:hypothetical protein